MNIFKNKTLLITGGTGSFGKAVLKKFINSNAKQIRIFSRDEKKQEDLRLEYNSKKLQFFIGDVRDSKSINEASKGVDYIFHAAALKQVPSCEFFPLEAVNTNVIGTENTITAAISNNVKKIVILSTDKAVYPINAMGISKAMAEKIAIAKSRNSNNTVICITRYGNVMGSRGSVIPLFISQLNNNLPITITNPKMTRFLMSLEDSVSLVTHAFQKGKQGDIFVMKSPGTSIEILAKSISKLYGKKNNSSIIGTRHGEKLYETLISSEESLRLIESKKFYRIFNDDRDLNYKLYFTKGMKNKKVFEYNSHNTVQLNVDEVMTLLRNNSLIKGDIDA